MISYEHTQRFPLRFWIFGAAALVASVLLENLGLAAAGVVIVLLDVLFGSLTVIVTSASLACRFGMGLFRITFELADISDAVVVRNKWWYGWGIRSTPRGWMWNVSGLDAVMITRSNAKPFVIGTDEPQRLQHAILNAVQGAAATH